MLPLHDAEPIGARWRVALEWASLVFIALPFVIFAIGWLRPWVALPCVLVSVAGLVRAARGAVATRAPGEADAGDSAGSDAWLKKLTYPVAVLAVIVVVVYSGTGGYSAQLGGHNRNNAFVLDLSRGSWPVAFEDVGRDHEPGVLAFYIANALPPALVASVFGWGAGFFFQFAWTCLGLFLAVCWFLRLVGASAPQWALLFLFFGGLDLFGFWLLGGAEVSLRWSLDMWQQGYAALRPASYGGMFWIFPSNLTILHFSPHHVLCSWIVLMMILDDAIHRGTSRRVGLLVSFALLWSAFSFVGMAPFVILALILTRGREMFSFENLAAGVVVLATSALYLASNNGDYIHGPLWRYQDLRDTGLVLLLVCVLEFGIYGLLLARVEDRRHGLAHPAWRWTAIVTLLLVPWYRIGVHCDFTTKVSIPALLVLQLCLAHALATAGRPRNFARYALIGLLTIGTAASLGLMRRKVSMGLRFAPPIAARVAPTNEIDRQGSGGQLFADGQGFFWQHLARPIVYRPNSAWKPRAGGNPYPKLGKLRRARDAAEPTQDAPKAANADSASDGGGRP